MHYINLYLFRGGYFCLILLVPFQFFVAVQNCFSWSDLRGHEEQASLAYDTASENNDETEEIREDLEDPDDDAKASLIHSL